MEATGESTNHKGLTGRKTLLKSELPGSWSRKLHSSVVVGPGRMSLRRKNSAKRKLLSWKASRGYGA